MSVSKVPPSTTDSFTKTIGYPSRTTSPSPIETAQTIPLRSALISCCNFIASTTATSWPTRTSSPLETSTATIVPWIGEARPTEPSGPTAGPLILPSTDSMTGAPPTGSVNRRLNVSSCVISERLSSTNVVCVSPFTSSARVSRASSKRIFV